MPLLNAWLQQANKSIEESPRVFKARPEAALKHPPISLRQLFQNQERRIVDAEQLKEAVELDRDQILDLLRKERMLANLKARKLQDDNQKLQQEIRRLRQIQSQQAENSKQTLTINRR